MGTARNSEGRGEPTSHEHNGKWLALTFGAKAEDSDLQPPIASYLVVPYFAVLYNLRRRKGEKAFVYPNDEFAPLNANSEAVTMIVVAAASAAAKGHQKPEQDKQRGVGTYGRPDGD